MRFFPTSTPFTPLRFTHEKESNHCLPFLDVLVERRDSEFSTSVYRKPTFTGQYLRWNSFSPHKQKINLIGTLVHRAFVICSKGKLDPELDKILSILLENLIKSTIKRKLQQLNLNPVHTVKKCPVYLHFPWIGNVSMKFDKQITSAVKRCFFSVEPRVVFTTRQFLPATKKDVLPSHQQNNVIYQFVCHRDSRYVGRTSQRLEERIKQHIQNRLPILLLHTSVKAFPALVRTPVPDNFTNPPSVNIFLTAPNVPYITIRINSLSSLELPLHFTSPPWK